MSVRLNGSGDKLVVAAANGIGTGAFALGFWTKLVAGGDGFTAFPGFYGATPSTAYHAVGTDNSATDMQLFSTVGGDGLGTGVNFRASTTVWRYFVLSRSGTTMRLRMFDDSTSTTPIGDVTATAGGNFSTVNSQFGVGNLFGTEVTNAEVACVRVHVGVAWSDAQCRAESQKLAPQTGGGSIYGNWKLETITADANGINDSGGANRHFTNTGCVNGASRPSQLESASTDVTVTLTGVASAGAVNAGTETGTGVAPLTGVSATSAVNAPAVALLLSVPITGVTATPAVHVPTVTGTAIAPLTGVAVTPAVGAVIAAAGANADVAGVAATPAVNAPTVVGSAVVPLTGVSVTSAVNTPDVDTAGNITVALDGLTSQSNVGALAVIADCIAQLTGVSVTSAVGTLSATCDVTVALLGVAGTSTVGSLGVAAGAGVALTGVTTTPAVNAPAVTGTATLTLGSVGVVAHVGALGVLDPRSTILIGDIRLLTPTPSIRALTQAPTITPIRPT